MISSLLFALAYAFDWVVGDPGRLPHPVRWMGRMISSGERWFRRLASGPRGEFVAGLLLTLLVTGTFGVGAWLLLSRLERFSHSLAFAVSLYLAMTTLATRSLLDESRSVLNALKNEDLSEARRRVARIVGRDTGDLDSPEVTRAVIETLAESASDGIVAPMFYLVVGGAPAALAYKAINTLDSMIGHHGERYEFFGKSAARLDDAANFIPARLTGLLFAVAAGLLRLDWRNACRVMMRDAAKHESPNAGRPEAAMAGALGVRLGGTNYYDSAPHIGPHLGDSHNPLDLRALKDGLRLTACVSLLMFALSISALLLISNL